MRSMLKKFTALLLVLAMLFSLCSCAFTAEEAVDKAEDTVKKFSDKASTLFEKAQDKIRELYGTAKDSAVYLYDEAAELTAKGYDKANRKSEELLGNVKTYIEGLSEGLVSNEITFASGDPDRPVKDLPEGADFNEDGAVIIDGRYLTEQFAAYYISSVLSARGYEVYNGVVYYKNEIYGGLIFTKGDVFIEEDGEEICSCGFVQLVGDNYDGIVITDNMVLTGLIAVSAGVNGEDEKAFIVDEYAVFDDFSGIYNGYYFCYQQEDHYVLRVSVKDNDKANYVDGIELYNFDKNRLVHKAKNKDNTETAVEELYKEDSKGFNSAATTVNAIVDIGENSENEIATVITVDGDTVDKIMSKASKGYDKVKSFAEKSTEGLRLEGSQVLSIDSDGKAYVLGSENAADESRVTNGIITTVASGLAAAGAVASIVCVAEGGTVVVSAIVITTGTSAIVYNVSNMLSGAQDIYYGAKGDLTEADNPALKLFEKYIPDEETANMVYHIWGVGSTILSNLMIPAAKALSIAKVKGLNTFEAAVNVVRASVISAAKILASGVGAGIVANYVGKVVTKVTNNENIGKLVGFGTVLVTGFLTYKGLDTIDKKLDISGLYPKSAVKTSFVSARSAQKLRDQDLTEIDRGELNDGVNELVDIAVERYGIKEKPTVRIIYDSTDPTSGYYSSSDNTITVNMRAWEHNSWKGVANTIGHEMRHAYQFQIAEQHPNGDMANSLKNYIVPKNDFSNYDAYRNQLCENDAFEAGDSFAEYIMTNLIRI